MYNILLIVSVFIACSKEYAYVGKNVVVLFYVLKTVNKPTLHLLYKKSMCMIYLLF